MKFAMIKIFRLETRFLFGNKIFKFKIENFVWKQYFLNMKSRFSCRNKMFIFEI